ncbi:MAG: MarR family transcriptional regulator [Pseudomonadota bacterium]
MSNESDHPDDLHELITLFERFGPLYARAVHDSLRDADSTPSRLRLLGVLDAQGPSTMQALADALCVAPRTVTTLVDGLEAESLVERTPHPTDRRAKTIAATKAGEAAFRNSRESHLSRLAEVFAVLSAPQRAALIDGHRTLLAELKARYRE